MPGCRTGRITGVKHWHFGCLTQTSSTQSGETWRQNVQHMLDIHVDEDILTSILTWRVVLQGPVLDWSRTGKKTGTEVSRTGPGLGNFQSCPQYWSQSFAHGQPGRTVEDWSGLVLLHPKGLVTDQAVCTFFKRVKLKLALGWC